MDENFTVRIAEDMSLVHYLNLIERWDGELIVSCICDEHSDCTITLCGRHTTHGVVVEEGVTCMECAMEIGFLAWSMPELFKVLSLRLLKKKTNL